MFQIVLHYTTLTCLPYCMRVAEFTTYKYYLSQHPSCRTLDICGLEQIKLKCLKAQVNQSFKVIKPKCNSYSVSL